MSEYLIFNTEEQAAIALDKINALYDYPCEKRATLTWAEVQKAHDLDLWYFPKPTDEFMEGVENFTVMEFDPAWLPSEDLLND